MVPLSVLSNWTTQIQEHINAGKLKSYVYYGEGRGATAAAMAKCDVVLTTYEMVTGDWKRKTGQAPAKKKAKTDSGLFGVKWKVCIGCGRRARLRVSMTDLMESHRNSA